MSDPTHESSIDPASSTTPSTAAPASSLPTIRPAISAVQPSVNQPVNQPTSPVPALPVLPTRPRSPRGNAFGTLILAALALASLALPWIGFGGFSESSSSSLSGFDLIKLTSGSASDPGDITNIQLVEWLSIGMIALSFLRMLAPAGTSGLAVLGGLALLGAVAWTDIHLFQSLNNASDFPGGIKPGPVAAGIAAILCAIAACRAPGAVRADRDYRVWEAASRPNP